MLRARNCWSTGVLLSTFSKALKSANRIVISNRPCPLDLKCAM